ncbi:MAG: hypothetical protein ACI35W_02365 [Anaeroplasmataceae bacterium]
MKNKLKKITAVSAIITFISFLYKGVLSYLTLSLVLLIAAISTFLIFIVKLLFVKNLTKSRANKKKAYLFMALALLVYSLIFIAFVVLKINGIDASNNKEYSGLVGYLLIGFMVLMFFLSLLNLKKAYEKTDLMVVGLKEMTFASALADLVIIEEFIFRIYFITKDYFIINTFHDFFPLVVGISMVFISILMLFRCIKYRP